MINHSLIFIQEDNPLSKLRNRITVHVGVGPSLRNEGSGAAVISTNSEACSVSRFHGRESSRIGTGYVQELLSFFLKTFSFTSALP